MRGTFAALLLVALGVSACTRVTRETVRFVKQDEALRTEPIITVIAVPTAEKDELQLRLSRKIQAALYEMEVTKEQARTLDIKHILVVAIASISGGGITFDTGTGTTTVNGQPRKIKDVDEVEQSWPGGTVTLTAEQGPTTQLTAGADGVVLVRLTDVLASVPRSSDAGLRLTLSATSGREQTTKTVEIAPDVVRRWSTGPRR
jgi:hypothetical protein